MKNAKNGSTATPKAPETVLLANQYKIVEYVRTCLSDRVQRVLDGRERGKSFPKLGRYVDRDFTTVHRHHSTAKEQMRLALVAPWMESFRKQVLAGESPDLPEAISSLDYQQVLAAEKLTPEQKQAILDSKHTVATRIEQEVGVSYRAILGVLKEAGRWPLLKDEDIVAAYHQAKGNISKAGRMLGLERTRLMKHLMKLGYTSKQKRGRKRKQESDSASA